MIKTELIMSKNVETAQSLDSAEGQLVVFALADEEFGVDINTVREIVRVPDITPIPQSPDYVAGICNLRGSVLPAINSRQRFGLEHKEADDSTRLLVIETGTIATGLIVDDVREVLHSKKEQMEEPPAVCKGVDREFLTGVVKMNDGARLILILDLDEVVQVQTKEAKSDQKKTALQAGKTAINAVEKNIDEEQLISFKVADEEYAFDINRVREILRVEEITEVPNAANYVQGLLTIRNQLLPILDLRTMLGNTSLIEQFHDEINAIMVIHEQWLKDLKKSLQSNATFNGDLDPTKCALGQWLLKDRSGDVGDLINNIRTPHINFHEFGAEALKINSHSQDEALLFFEEHIAPLEEILHSGFIEIKNKLAKNINEFQRILVVEAGDIHIGFIVDSVNEVLRIPKSIIDKTPWAASSAQKELKGVAKLDNGKRLIMIMDESTLIGQDESEELGKISEAGKKTADAETENEISLAQKDMDEEQLVTFIVANEEYGVRIMQVQEINRLEEITHVPRSPAFIDGVTNLRGNVIPVLNIRTLFGLESRDQDDATRIIIVEIEGRRTGLRVDKVNEVLRLPKEDIAPAPGIVTGDSENRFIEGVCQLDHGKRMVLLLDINEILSAEDKKEIATMEKKKTKPRAPKKNVKKMKIDK
ncbi:MAG: chemotaxis protein CheW [Candidatus Desulfofervidaceae bacterium]|nr:chemotaxis protein CheW [Candidatus Desulfofervidaceae bacterium]